MRLQASFCQLSDVVTKVMQQSALGAGGYSVRIATGYGLDGPGMESRWKRDFPHLSRPAWGPPSLLYNVYRVSLRGAWR